MEDQITIFHRLLISGNLQDLENLDVNINIINTEETIKILENIGDRTKAYDVINILIHKGFNMEGMTIPEHFFSLGNADIIRQLVGIGMIIPEYYENDYGYKWTPLILAIKFGHIDIMDFLFEYGVNVNFVDNEGNTGLYYACLHNTLASDLVDRLIEQNANLKLNNENDQNDNARISLIINLILKYNTSIIQKLFINGFDIYFIDNNGDDPLIIASANDRLDILKFYYELGKDINHTNNKGQSALSFAIITHNYLIIEYLLSLKDIDVNIPFGLDIDIYGWVPDKMEHRTIRNYVKEKHLPEKIKSLFEKYDINVKN